jgi:hypothetical protein
VKPSHAGSLVALCVLSVGKLAFAQNAAEGAAPPAAQAPAAMQPQSAAAQGPAPAGPPVAVPFGVPAAGTNLESHLGSSSQASSDITRGDDFDFAPGSSGNTVVRGNPNAPGILAVDLSGNSGLYVVKSGDTLSGISQQVYGQPWMWPKLWSLNPQIQNPHWVYPGDQIRLTGVNGAAGRPQQVKTLGAGGLNDRRAAVPEDTVFLRRTGYLDDPANGISGEVVGAENPVQLMSEGDTVYLAIKPGTSVSVGQRLTIFRPSRKPPSINGARRPPGMIVAIQGTVAIDYFDPKTQVARGSIVESLDAIERGAKVGDLGRRFQIVPPKKADNDVSARILTSMYPHVLLGEEQVVFIDRGSKDGLLPGNRLFVVRRGDTWRRTLSTAGSGAQSSIKMDSTENVDVEATPLHGNEQHFPEEIVGELRVVDAQPYSAYAVITDSRVELLPGDRAIARVGF